MDNIKQLVASCEAAVSGKATRDDVKRIVGCLMSQAPTDLLAAISEHAWARIDGFHALRTMVHYNDKLLPFAVMMDNALNLLGDEIHRLRGPARSLPNVTVTMLDKSS